MAKANKNEVATSNTFDDGKSVVLFDPSKFKKVADLVLPSISIKNMKEDDTLYVQVESEIRKVQQTDEKTGEIKLGKDGQPSLLPIVIARNLATNQRGQLVLPAIVLRGMESAGEISGRKFAMQKGVSLGVGKANLWEVVEIADAE